MYEGGAMSDDARATWIERCARGEEHCRLLCAAEHTHTHAAGLPHATRCAPVVTDTVAGAQGRCKFANQSIVSAHVYTLRDTD